MPIPAVADIFLACALQIGHTTTASLYGGLCTIVLGLALLSVTIFSILFIIHRDQGFIRLGGVLLYNVWRLLRGGAAVGQHS
jgi:hypothetical protein